MPFGWSTLPAQLSADWMAYREMLNEFSQGIANAINDLTRYTHQLAAWREVVSILNDSEKLDVAVEFVDPLATISLNLPYVIRSRLIFAAAHLSHQAARNNSDKEWTDNLPVDEEIYMKQAQISGASWKSWRKLKLKIERVGDKSYQSETNDFRHSYNHRFSPRIVIGLTNMVTRQVDAKTNQVSYAFGSTAPLSLRVVVELLEKQCEHCYGAFEAFQILVKEHENKISAVEANRVNPS